MKHSKYSFVIVGSGIAGLYASLKWIKEKGINNIPPRLYWYDDKIHPTEHCGRSMRGLRRR